MSLEVTRRSEEVSGIGGEGDGEGRSHDFKIRSGYESQLNKVGRIRRMDRDSDSASDNGNGSSNGSSNSSSSLNNDRVEIVDSDTIDNEQSISLDSNTAALPSIHHPFHSYSYSKSRTHAQKLSSSSHSSESSLLSNDSITRSSRSWSTDSRSSIGEREGEEVDKVEKVEKDEIDRVNNANETVDAVTTVSAENEVQEPIKESQNRIINPSTSTNIKSRNSLLPLSHSHSNSHPLHQTHSHTHTHSHSRLSLSNNSITPPQNSRKKRLSLNFAALPVVSTSNQASSPTIKENRRRTTSVSFAGSTPISSSGSSPKLKSSISVMGLASGSGLNTNHSHSNSQNYNHNNHSLNSDNNSDNTSPPLKQASIVTPTSSMDLYLSQLAAKERKVVELKDEIKRAQVDLKRAELELKLFREGASQALGPKPKKNSMEERERRRESLLGGRYTNGWSIETEQQVVEPIPTPGLILSHQNLQQSQSQSQLKGNQTQQQSKQLHQQLQLQHSESYESQQSHNVIHTDTLPTTTTTTSPSYPRQSLEKPPQLYQSSRSHPYPPQRLSSSGKYGACLDPDRSPPKPPQDDIIVEWPSRPHFPPKDDVINMGKRVVEELGTQFWGLFEDIKNVTIGEEPREYTGNDNYNENQNQPQNKATSKKSNSYYIL